MEIRLSQIIDKSVQICHVPPEIADKNLLDYVHKNIGLQDGSDSDSEDDEDFIIDGDLMGFFQYGRRAADDSIYYAPNSNFINMYLSFETDHGPDLLAHPFVIMLQDKYLSEETDKSNAFKTILTAMLSATPKPSVIDVHNVCLRYEHEMNNL